jgi:hypothetical protein
MDAEVVYCTEMADKPTVAVLDERLGTAIKLAIGFGAATVAVAIYFLTTIHSHGERLSKMEGQIDGIDKNVNRLLDRGSRSLLMTPAAGGTIATMAAEIGEALRGPENENLIFLRNG